MIGYSTLAILKGCLADAYDRDIAAGREPFTNVNTAYWSQTSGHTEETVSETMEQIRRDRETRVEPAVDPILPCEGK